MQTFGHGEDGRSEDGFIVRKKMVSPILFVGDICYALNDDIYDKIWGGHNYKDGEYVEHGFIVGSTAFGDGCYEDENGHEFGVDAGVIGVTDYANHGNGASMEDSEHRYGLHALGVIVEVPSGIADVYFKDANGIFDIEITDSDSGAILYSGTIDTLGEEPDEDEYDEEYDEEEEW